MNCSNDYLLYKLRCIYHLLLYKNRKAIIPFYNHKVLYVLIIIGNKDFISRNRVKNGR